MLAKKEGRDCPSRWYEMIGWRVQLELPVCLSFLHMITKQVTLLSLFPFPPHIFVIICEIGMHGYPADYLLSGQIVAFSTICIYLYLTRDIFAICICIWPDKC